MQCSMRIRIPIAKSFGELLVGDRPELEEVLGEGYNVSYEYDQGPSICERDVWLLEEYVELT